LVLKTPYFEIRKIEIAGEKELQEENIKELVLQNQNFFLLNSLNLSQSIEKTFPKIKSIKVKKKFPNSILIEIIEREAIGIYCQEQEGKSCFLISDDGVIFSLYPREEKKEMDQKNSLLKILEKREKKFKIGDRAIEEDLVSNFIFLKNELSRLNIFIEEIEILPLEIRMRTKNDLKLYFLSGTDFKKQVEALPRAFDEIISAKERKELRYIDLRELKEGKKGKIYLK
jgi:hypothetical protein